MPMFKYLSFLIILCGAKCDETEYNKCDIVGHYKDLKNIKINDLKTYCHNNTCIVKCCGHGEFLDQYSNCKNIDDFFKRYRNLRKLRAKINFVKQPILRKTGCKQVFKYVNEKKLSDFRFIQNDIMKDKNCSYQYSRDWKFHILEDGAVKLENKNSLPPWIDIDPLSYCIDFKLGGIKKNNKTMTTVYLVLTDLRDKPGESRSISIFTAVGMLVSCVFLLLVVVVHLMLRDLRNLLGLVLMSYASTLFITFLLKIIIMLVKEYLTPKWCKRITPPLYYAVLSSIFWLNIMSFEVWSALRRNQKINPNKGQKRRIPTKFWWYCLYAWGTPLVLTIVVTILDNVDLKKFPNVIKPPFDDCLYNVASIHMYFNVPIGILILINVILFIDTSYNMLKTSCGVTRSKDSKSTNDKIRYYTFLKISVVMGVSWCLELINTDVLWQFILINSYNVLTGVIIFFFFIFERRVLRMLVQKFNMDNHITRKFNLSERSQSGTTKSTRASSTRTVKPRERESIF